MIVTDRAMTAVYIRRNQAAQKILRWACRGGGVLASPCDCVATSDALLPLDERAQTI